MRDTAVLAPAADAPLARARAALMPSAPRTVRYRPDIDGLRAVAVTSVIVYHAFPGVLPGGFLGVDVFFVISGYLITQLILQDLRERRFSLAEFYRRRARRILPALLVVLAASVLFGWYALLPYELIWLGRSIAWSATFMANIFFARAGNYGGYFDPRAELSPLVHLWSLGVEEQFYLGWPVILLLASRARVVVPALSAIIVVSLALSLLGGWFRPDQSFYLPTSRGWELACGGILAAAHAGRLDRAVRPTGGLWSVRSAEVMSVLGLGLIFVGARFLTSDPPLSGLLGVAPCVGTLLLITLGPRAAVNRYLLATPAAAFIGRISYPLYLWHWPALSFTRMVLGRSLTAAEASVAVLLAGAAAYATCRLVEEPIRFGRRRRWVVPALLGALGGIAALGAGIGAGSLVGRLCTPTIMAWQVAMADWKLPAVPRRDDLWTFAATSQRGTTALFIGDSHIQQYWPRARLVVQTHPRQARSALFATYFGCPPLPDIAGWYRGSACSSGFKHAMKLALRKDVDTVIFGAFWEDYFIGQFPGWRTPWGGLGVYSEDDELRRQLTLDSSGTERALEDFGRAISRLRAHGRKVLILLSNPTSPRFDPLYLLPAADRLSLYLPDRISVEPGMRAVDARRFESFVAPLMNRLRDVATRNGASVIDPREGLCGGMICPAIDAHGMPTHLDSNHLTSTFARDRATFIDDILLAPAAAGE